MEYISDDPEIVEDDTEAADLAEGLARDREITERIRNDESRQPGYRSAR